MKIAVASQNRKTITDHAGRCRNFWIYQIQDQKIVDKSLLALAKEQSFHETPINSPHPLDGTDVLLLAGMGSGLKYRLETKKIKPIITDEDSPDLAVEKYLAGTLEELPFIDHPHHHQGHGHHHQEHHGGFHASSEENNKKS